MIIFKELSKKHSSNDENDTSSPSGSEEEEQRKPTKRKHKEPISINLYFLTDLEALVANKSAI